MEQRQGLRRRVAESLIEEALSDTRVVTINGARDRGRAGAPVTGRATGAGEDEPGAGHGRAKPAAG